MLYTVRGLRDDVRGVIIRLRVISKKPSRQVTTKDGSTHLVVDAQVGDRTGILLLSLWDDEAQCVQEGDVIDINNGYVTRFKGQLRLNIGRYGTVEQISESDFPTTKEIQESQRHRSHRRKVMRDKF